MTTAPQNRHEERVLQDIDAQIPRVEWDDFFRYEFDWRQGQHVAAIGPTGSGKTTLAMAVLEKRRNLVVLATKPRDETLEALEKSDKFLRMKEWKSLSPVLYPKRILWPDAKDLYSARTQQKEFRNALKKIYREGYWCVYIDELWFIIHHLKLELEVRTFLQQARSNKISLFVCTQRPAFVPLEVYDQSTHLFFWKDNDKRNLDRISGIAWLNSAMIRSVVARLEKHEVLYINTETGFMCRTMAPPPGGK